MKIIVLYYGAFRSLGKQAILSIDSPAPVHAIKKSLTAYLGSQHQALIEDSVLANDTDILPDDFVLEQDCTLFILPPVCGG